MDLNIAKSLFPQKGIIGIDIGNYAVKLVSFVEEKKVIKLKDWGYIPLDFPPDITPEEKKVFVSEEIKKYLKKKGIQFKFAAASISGNSVIVRYVKLPKLSKKELALTLHVEAEPFIPFDINDVNLTCWPLNDITEEGQPKMETVLVAAKKDVVDSKIEVLSDAGLDPIIIDVDAFALESLYEWHNPEVSDVAILFLNIGHKVTNLSIIAKGTTRVVRDIFIAGASFDKAISKSFKVEIDAAGELKKQKGVLLSVEDKEGAIEDYDKEYLGVSKASHAVLQDLYTEISRSIDFYLSQGVEQSISRIILTGGMSNLGNISKYISEKFKVPVEILNPLAPLAEQTKNIPKDVLPALAVATGLALRKLKDWE
ncbi:MAG: type IV pilus assembly protein PilM [Elusimicrobiales bacterium]|nr:type IV pilus assembly protein PilM [Elusimicrobiales bacterium]